MSTARIIHVTPIAAGGWEVRPDGAPCATAFTDLGLALDAATALAEPLRTARVVIHEAHARRAS